MITDPKYDKKRDVLNFSINEEVMEIDSDGDLTIPGDCGEWYLSIVDMREIVQIYQDKGKYSDV